MRDLFFLSAADLAVRSSLVEPGPLFAKGRESLSCTVAVCVRDDGDLVLVDAGFSEAACRDPAAAFSALTLRWFGLRLAEERAIVRQLEALGFDRGQVRAVIATHCHFDHIGGLCDFPNAELITTPDELGALGGCGFRPGYRPADLACADRIRAAQLTGPRHLGFPASLDLFGDGEITLLDAEGHAPGHLAVALAGPGATYLHAGDAVFLEWEAGRGFEGPGRLSRLVCADRRALGRTLTILRELDVSEPQPPILVPAHDRHVFEALPHAPGEAAMVDLGA